MDIERTLDALVFECDGSDRGFLSSVGKIRIVGSNLTLLVEHGWLWDKPEVRVFRLQRFCQLRTDENSVVPCELGYGVRAFLHPTVVDVSAVPSVKIRNNEEVQVVRTGKVRCRIEILEIVGKLNDLGMRRGFLGVNA